MMDMFQPHVLLLDSKGRGDRGGELRHLSEIRHFSPLSSKTYAPRSTREHFSLLRKYHSVLSALESLDVSRVGSTGTQNIFMSKVGKTWNALTRKTQLSNS